LHRFSEAVLNQAFQRVYPSHPTVGFRLTHPHNRHNLRNRNADKIRQAAPAAQHRDTEVAPMVRFLLLLVLMFSVNCCDPLSAQEMRVRTTISRQESNGSWRPFAYSLTLFHAGKVYDYMEDVGEVVIYEPMSDRFVLLDGNYRAAELTITELNQFLKSSEAKSQDYLTDLKRDGSDTAKKEVAALEFQLRPQFDERFDSKEQRLRMNSQQIDYTVTTGSSPNPDDALKYLKYADWAARLNHILHPEALLPEARLAVNSALRNRKRIPLKVDLRVRADGEVHLQAEHQFSWELQAMDKRHISQWESRMASKEAIWVSFRDYQRKLLTAK